MEDPKGRDLCVDEGSGRSGESGGRDIPRRRVRRKIARVYQSQIVEGSGKQV